MQTACEARQSDKMEDLKVMCMQAMAVSCSENELRNSFKFQKVELC